MLEARARFSSWRAGAPQRVRCCSVSFVAKICNDRHRASTIFSFWNVNLCNTGFRRKCCLHKNYNHRSKSHQTRELGLSRHSWQRHCIEHGKVLSEVSRTRVIPVVAIVRRMLEKRSPKLHSRRREIFCAGTALGCVVTLMLCLAAATTRPTNSGHSSSPGKLLRSALPGEESAIAPSVMHALPAMESLLFEPTQRWMVRRSQAVIAISVYKTRLVANRAPPFF